MRCFADLQISSPVLFYHLFHHLLDNGNSFLALFWHVLDLSFDVYLVDISSFGGTESDPWGPDNWDLKVKEGWF